MARIIFTSRYLKNAPSKKIKNLITYMATRPGAEIFKETDNTRPATDRQKEFIDEHIKLLPEIKDSFEYEDYLSNPSIVNASELISSIAEKSLDGFEGRKNYVDYIAKRPKAERSADGHGLWNGSDEKINLSQVAEEVANHKGNIWTHVISLRREDAERLKYDNAAVWRDLVKSKLPAIAKNMDIPLDQLKWYGAYHDMGHHPHIHLLVYSQDPKKGFLKKEGIDNMRHAFGTAIFHDDLMHVYVQKDEAREQLNKFADEKVKKIIESMESKDFDNPIIAELLVRLSKELKTVKGKKDYGWLKGSLKLLVDNIVAELSKDKNVAELYEHWCDLKDEISKTYTKNPPKHGELSDEMEFRKIKNMVIRYAKDIGEFDPALFEAASIDRSVIELEPAMDADIPGSLESAGELMEADSSPVSFEDTVEVAVTEAIGEPTQPPLAPVPAAAPYAKWTDKYKQGRAYLYGKGITQDYEKAIEILSAEAKAGNAFALYDMGKIYSSGLGVEPSSEKAHEYYEKALNAFVSVEAVSNNDYIQYRIGKMFMFGIGTEKDSQKAAEWFEQASSQGNQFAQYSLGNLYFRGDGVVQSYETAFGLYTESYSKGNAFAAYELGKMYRDGIGTDIDTAESQECFAAAYAGFVTAERKNGGDQLQYRLGQMCIACEGTEENIPLAVEYLKKAADLGNIHAMHSLTKLYMDKKSESIDIRSIIEKLTTAAEQGNDFAQYALGNFYVFDKAERDIETAKYWLKLSAEQGNAYAQKLIEFINNPQYQMTSAAAAINLLRSLNRMIADDYQKQQKRYDIADKKLMKKIMQKKEDLGQKQTFE